MIEHWPKTKIEQNLQAILIVFKKQAIGSTHHCIRILLFLHPEISVNIRLLGEATKHTSIQQPENSRRTQEIPKIQRYRTDWAIR
jgi:hypothetical protein